MDSIDLIQTFREVARLGSFSAAARAMDVSVASVSKCVVQLEQRFGVRLFHRTTRKVSLTDAGELLYERSGPLLEMIDLTKDELQARATVPMGRLSVSLPPLLMQTPLLKLIGRFLSQHPKVSMHLLATERQVNLVDEGIDVALRVGALPDGNVIARRLIKLPRVLAATPAYWRAHGRPQHPRDLLEHRTLVASPMNERPRWQFVEAGKPFELLLQPHVEATEATPLIELALQDLGVLCLTRAALAGQLASGALETVLDDFMPDDTWLHALYAQRRHNSAALRALLAFLEEQSQRYLAGATA